MWPAACSGIALALATITPDPIVTDRPDFTESSVVVPAGTTQVETGLTWRQEDSQTRTLGGPEVLVRLGIDERFELRLGLPSYTIVDSFGVGRQTGWDDIYAGLKYQLGPTADGTNFAVIPAVFVPVGTDGIRSEVVSPEVKFVWSREVGAGRALSGMIYVAQTESGGRRTYMFQHTLSLGLPLRDRIAMFLEHVLDVSKGERPAHLLHYGFTYQPRPNLQFDVHFGHGLSPTATDFLVAGGFATRF